MPPAREYNAAMGTVALLTRGDEHWGTGHLRRTGWLKAALAVQDAVTHLAICSADSPLARRCFSDDSGDVRFFPADWIAASDSRLVDLAAEAELVVIDWLSSAPELVEALRSAGAKTALLDDYGPAAAQAELVINSLLAPLDRSSRPAGRAQVYFGVDYVQLPPAVTKLRGVAGAAARAMATELRAPASPSATVRAVLVSFGGIAPAALVDQVLACLRNTEYDGQVIVMPAPLPPAAAGADNIELVPAGDEFHSLLAASDLAICAGGLTLYEAAYLGIPAIVIAVPSGTPGYEHHQLDTARKLEAAGCCRSAGLAGEVTAAELTAIIREVLAAPQARLEMGARGMRLVDGRGLMRTVELLLNLL